MPLFELLKRKIHITQEGETVQEVKDLREKFYKNRQKLEEIVEYIWKVYSKDSPFYNDHLLDRKKSVSQDVWKKPTLWERIEEIPQVKDLIEIYKKLQFTHSESLVEGANQKIEEYVQIWKETPVTIENHDAVKDLIKGAQELLKMKVALRKIVLEEREEKDVGGGKPAMFEDNE